MGPLRGVLDAADSSGRRNAYLHRVHVYALRRFLRSRKKPFQSGLDFGCGTGRFLPLLSRYCETLSAVDRSSAMVDAARTYNPRLAGAIAYCDDGTLPFDNDSFDFILSFCVLSVTSDERAAAALDELARVCKTRGTLILCEKVADGRLSFDSYKKELLKRNFKILAHYPLRSGTSKFTPLGSAAWLNPPAARMLAALEFQMTRRRRYATTNGSYVEYFFECERSA